MFTVFATETSSTARTKTQRGSVALMIPANPWPVTKANRAQAS
jgi:hypothetical protein